MTDKDLLSRMLGIEDPWRIVEVKLNLEGRLLEVIVECVQQQWGDESGRRIHLHGYEERRWRHLDAFQFQTIIHARVPRLRYPADDPDENDDDGTGTPQMGRTALLAVPWAERGSRFTAFFEAWAMCVLQACRSVAEGARLLNLTWDQAHGLMHRAVDRGMERRQVTEITHVAIDEKSFGKGQSYGTLLSDPGGRRVLEVTPERDTAAACTAIGTLPAEQRKKIISVSMDMSPAYQAAAAQALPGAAVVFDRFHISKLLGEAVDKVRRAEHRQLTAQGDTRLKGTKYYWLESPENMSAQRMQEFEDVFVRSLATARAWEVKESFASFYEQPDAGAAREFARTWLRRLAARKGMEAMKRAGETIRRHLDGLLNWYEHRVSNAFSEGINSLVSVIKSGARGFRNFANYRTRILFHHGKLDMAPHCAQASALFPLK
jgi:transposase